MMNRFVIIVNALKDKQLLETKKLCGYIREKGGSCEYLVSVDEREGIQKVDAGNIPKGTECILVLGGDGTLIRAARDIVECGIPLLGINMGTLGYLCEVEEGGACAAIDAIMKGEYMLEERMMLTGQEYRAEQAGGSRREEDGPWIHTDKGRTGQRSYRALNDIVIHRTGALSLVNLVVYVNGRYLYTFKGDGIILSTPTGSTGYNMSAGGPIVDPKAQMLLLTPINSHTLSPRSIVLDAQDEIMIEVNSRRVQRDETVEVSFDGDHGFRLYAGSRICVRRADEKTKILKFSRISFLEILRKKMQTFY